MCDHKNIKTAEEQRLENCVEADRITLVDGQNEEYEFLVVDEFDIGGKHYLALVSCDEKTDMGNGSDPGESNDITVVRAGMAGGEQTLFAVTDADELLTVARAVESRFGHLGDQ